MFKKNEVQNVKKHVNNSYLSWKNKLYRLYLSNIFIVLLTHRKVKFKRTKWIYWSVIYLQSYFFQENYSNLIVYWTLFTSGLTHYLLC